MPLAYGTEGVDFLLLHWSNGKTRYFDQRPSYNTRGQPVAVLGSGFYTFRGPEASADSGSPRGSRFNLRNDVCHIRESVEDFLGVRKGGGVAP